MARPSRTPGRGPRSPLSARFSARSRPARGEAGRQGCAPFTGSSTLAQQEAWSRLPGGSRIRSPRGCRGSPPASRASGTRMQACTHARAHAQLNASLGQAGRRLTPASSSAANMEMTHFAHLTPGRICTSQQRTTGRGASRGRGRRGSGQATSPVTAARAWAWAPGPRGSRGACDQSTRRQDAGYI